MELSKNQRQTIYERALREEDEARQAYAALAVEHADIVQALSDAHQRVVDVQHDLETFGESDDLLDAFDAAEAEWQDVRDAFDHVFCDSMNILKGKMNALDAAYEAYIA